LQFIARPKVCETVVLKVRLTKYVASCLLAQGRYLPKSDSALQLHFDIKHLSCCSIDL
jgi:hypothetical protein